VRLFSGASQLGLFPVEPSGAVEFSQSYFLSMSQGSGC